MSSASISIFVNLYSRIHKNIFIYRLFNNLEAINKNSIKIYSIVDSMLY